MAGFLQFLTVTFVVTMLQVKTISNTANKRDHNWETAKSVYEFTVKDIKGQDVCLEKYKGHVLIIVNTASECGYSVRHNKELNELEEKYRDKGLKILAFPCNQFAKQEPGDADTICKIAKENKMKYDLFDKIEVNGIYAHPLYKYLKSQKGDGVLDDIKWNFTKFIIDKNGVPVERFPANINPLFIEDKIVKYF